MSVKFIVGCGLFGGRYFVEMDWVRMLLGLGIDIVRTERFVLWHRYSDRALGKLFSEAEVGEYRKIVERSDKAGAQFLASRFAAKEAAFKAINQAFVACGAMFELKFLNVARFLTVAKLGGIPRVHQSGPISEALEVIGNFELHLSISHETCHSVAVVCVSRG